MMTSLIRSRIIITIILLLSLAACGQIGTKKENSENSKPDLLELQKQADASYLDDDMAASERGYQILVREIPQIAEHWFRLGNIYVRTNRPVAAVNLYREAVLRDPKFAKAWFNMSIVQLKQSAYSLNEMLLYVDENHPMYSKAKGLFDGIQSIIEQN
jgi:cytochrome c-type biogenesis protein CcmH/NrfG